MKKLLITCVTALGVLTLLSFNTNENVKYSEGEQVQWKECTTTSCGTTNCHSASSGSSHYYLAAIDEYFDC